MHKFIIEVLLIDLHPNRDSISGCCRNCRRESATLLSHRVRGYMRGNQVTTRIEIIAKDKLFRANHESLFGPVAAVHSIPPRSEFALHSLKMY
jgi:hypothetical protein